MKIAITGAAGFVGGNLAKQLYALYDDIELVLMDVAFPETYSLSDAGECENPNKTIRYVTGDLQNVVVRKQIIGDGVDILFHLAAVPGGSAEADPFLSRRINLDATLSLFEEVALASNKPRVVYTSTIAVLGAELADPVDDNTPVDPAMVYGTHKAMVELALADMHRRGSLEAVAVRLPGIVARPQAPSGLKSAFMSNVFHTLRQGKPFVSPVSSSATFWLMSVHRCVSNLVHAGRLKESLMPRSRVVTLPALRCTMGDLCEQILRQARTSPALLSYEPDAELEKHFGQYPLLKTQAAEHADFAHDGNLESLVSSVFRVS